MLLSKVPIDIVEMVIVISDSYNVYENLQKNLIKLQENTRLSRINDKLTKVYIRYNDILYRLNNKPHREYDKPSYILKHSSNAYFYYIYSLHDCQMKRNGYSIIDITCRKHDVNCEYTHILLFDYKRFEMCRRVNEQIINDFL